MPEHIPLNEIRNRDAGMVLSLSSFLFFHYYEYVQLYWLGIVLLSVNICWPVFFTPFAKLWFWFGELLGFYVSAIILGLLYVFVVCPVALVLKIFSYDPFNLKYWKKGNDSIMLKMGCEITSKYLEKPY